MALDPEHHRAFLACQGNDVLTVFNLDTYRAIAHLPMAKGADVVAFDPGLGRIYVACSSGAISVFQEEDPDHFSKVEDFPEIEERRVGKECRSRWARGGVKKNWRVYSR